MRRTVGSWLVLILLGLGTSATGMELPSEHVPARPESRQELDRLEAKKLYAFSVLHERRHEWISALRLLERARLLDPDAAAIHKALVPLYTSLDRIEDAFASAERALKLDPDDFRVGYDYVRQLQRHNRQHDALAVLDRLTSNAKLDDYPELYLALWQESARLHEEAKLWSKSVQAYEHVVGILEQPERLEETGKLDRKELSTRTADAYEKLAHLYVKTSQPQRALSAWRQARLNNPKRATRLLLLQAELYLRQKDYPRAESAIDAYLRQEPQSVPAYELKLRILRASGQEQRILVTLRDATVTQPDNQPLQLLLAKEYRAVGQTGSALAIYSRLRKANPTLAVMRGWLETQEQIRTGVGEEVLAVLIAASSDEKINRQKRTPQQVAQARCLLLVLRDKPRAVRSTLEATKRWLVNGQRVPSDVRSWLAGIAERAGELELAERLFRSCLVFTKRSRTEVDIYAGLLRVLGQQRKHAEVLEICNRALENSERIHRVYLHSEMARAFVSLGQLEEAMKSANLAVNESNEDSLLQATLSRCNLRAKMGKHKEAISECQALLKKYTKLEDVRDVRYALSGVYTLAKDFPRAEAQLQRILDEDADDASACNDLGYLWADRNKNLEQAETLIRKAIELDRRERTSDTDVRVDSDRDNAAYEDSLGWVLFRRGKIKNAREHLERASRSLGGSDDPVIWDHLGDVYFRLEQPEQAEQNWKKALELFDAGQRRHDVGRIRSIREKLKYVLKK